MNNPENPRELGKFAFSLMGIELWDRKDGSTQQPRRPEWELLSAFETKYGISSEGDYSITARNARRDASNRLYALKQSTPIEEQLDPTSIFSVLFTYSLTVLHCPGSEAETSVFMAYEQGYLHMVPLTENDPWYKIGFRTTFQEVQSSQSKNSG